MLFSFRGGELKVVEDKLVYLNNGESITMFDDVENFDIRHVDEVTGNVFLIYEGILFMFNMDTHEEKIFEVVGSIFSICVSGKYLYAQEWIDRTNSRLCVWLIGDWDNIYSIPFDIKNFGDSLFPGPDGQAFVISNDNKCLYIIDHHGRILDTIKSKWDFCYVLAGKYAVVRCLRKIAVVSLYPKEIIKSFDSSVTCFITRNSYFDEQTSSIHLETSYIEFSENNDIFETMLNPIIQTLEPIPIPLSA